MAYIKAWMTSEDGKAVFCTCNDDHKVNVPRLKHHMEMVVPCDDQFHGNEDPSESRVPWFLSMDYGTRLYSNADISRGSLGWPYSTS
jgi:hypothetical protein